jgi:hypothetical protein
MAPEAHAVQRVGKYEGLQGIYVVIFSRLDAA